MASFSAVNWVLLDHASGDAVQVGDIVSADAGGMPTYQIVALQDGSAWVRDDRGASVAVPLNRFQWKAAGG